MAAALMLLGLCPGGANAQTLYGVGALPTSQLFTVNPATGVGTLVGPTPPFTSVMGLGFRGGKLHTFKMIPGDVLELNKATGAQIGSTSVGFANPSWDTGGFAFRSDGIGFVASGPNPGPNFYRFDMVAGTNTQIGVGFPLGNNASFAFNPADVLYGIKLNTHELCTIDQATGAITIIGPTGIGPGGVQAMAFDPTGKLYATHNQAGGADFYSVNTTTGAATLIGNLSGFSAVTGLAFDIGGPPPPTAGVTVTQSGGTTNVAEGGVTDTYTVVLNSAPTANVTITLNPGTQVTVAPAPLTFTPANWSTAQTVTVTAIDDAVVEGLHTGSITHTATSTDAAYSGIAIGSVTANITDNDAGPPVPPPTPPPPPPTGGEGNHSGSFGFGGAGEGSFGFGGIGRYRAPILDGPTSDAAGIRVQNVSHCGTTISEPADDGGWLVVGWTLIAGVVVAMFVGLGAKYRLVSAP